MAGAGVVAVPVPAGDAEAAWEVDAGEAERLAVAEGDAGAWLGLVLFLAEVEVVDGSVAEPDLLTGDVPGGDAGDDEDADSDGDGEVEGECDGDGEVECDGDGDGDALACTGSAWHDGLAAGVAGVVARDAACAVLAMLRVRKLPLSNVAVATRTCPKCISIACLR